MKCFACCIFQPNHLVGLKRTFLKLSFLTVEDLSSVKREIFPAIRKNKEREKSKDLYTEMLTRFANTIMYRIYMYMEFYDELLKTQN